MFDASQSSQAGTLPQAETVHSRVSMTYIIYGQVNIRIADQISDDGLNVHARTESERLLRDK